MHARRAARDAGGLPGHPVGHRRRHALAPRRRRPCPRAAPDRGPVDGETAYAWGLVNRLAPAEALTRTAADLLRQVTRHGPEVIAAQKALHQQWLDVPYSDAVERSIEPLLDAFRAGRPQQAARGLLER